MQPPCTLAWAQRLLQGDTHTLSLSLQSQLQPQLVARRRAAAAAGPPKALARSDARDKSFGLADEKLTTSALLFIAFP